MATLGRLGDWIVENPRVMRVGLHLAMLLAIVNMTLVAKQAQHSVVQCAAAICGSFKGVMGVLIHFGIILMGLLVSLIILDLFRGGDDGS